MTEDGVMKKQQTKISLFSLISLAITVAVSPAKADWGVGLDINNDFMQYKHKKNKVIVKDIFELQYRGDKFNMDESALSYDFTNSNKYGIELIAASKNLGYTKKDFKVFAGMDERDSSFDVGMRLIADAGLLSSAVFEVTRDVAASKGVEASLKIGGITPHAQHWTGEREVVVAAVAGVRHKDKKVANYYYGVKNKEATATRAAYQAKAATTAFVGLEAQANLTKHISLTADLGVSKTPDSIRNSPLTTGKKYFTNGKVGFNYWF